MQAAQAQALEALLKGQDVAALATLHNGEPAVSMVPYALLPSGQGFVIHVSRLATHTADMLAHPAVGLLVVAAADAAHAAAPPQARPRVSVQGHAQRCAPGDPLYAEARARYLARFPHSEEMFSFADFSLFIVGVRSARFIGGFAQAVSVTAADFAGIIGGAAPAPEQPSNAE
jgi:putative heme iron utilization protein